VLFWPNHAYFWRIYASRFQRAVFYLGLNDFQAAAAVFSAFLGLGIQAEPSLDSF
jgi:hypothetical protein